MFCFLIVWIVLSIPISLFIASILGALGVNEMEAKRRARVEYAQQLLNVSQSISELTKKGSSITLDESLNLKELRRQQKELREILDTYNNRLPGF